jgi:hypothetical protein
MARTAHFWSILTPLKRYKPRHNHRTTQSQAGRWAKQPAPSTYCGTRRHFQQCAPVWKRPSTEAAAGAEKKIRRRMTKVAQFYALASQQIIEPLYQQLVDFTVS